MNLEPLKILRGAIKAVPSVKYALGIAGIISVIAIIKSLSISFPVAAFGTLIMLILMTLLVVFANLSTYKSRFFYHPSVFLVWCFVVFQLPSAD